MQQTRKGKTPLFPKKFLLCPHCNALYENVEADDCRYWFDLENNKHTIGMWCTDCYELIKIKGE